MSARMSVSVSWNGALKEHFHNVTVKSKVFYMTFELDIDEVPCQIYEVKGHFVLKLSPGHTQTNTNTRNQPIAAFGY